MPCRLEGMSKQEVIMSLTQRQFSHLTALLERFDKKMQRESLLCPNKILKHFGVFQHQYSSPQVQISMKAEYAHHV